MYEHLLLASAFVGQHFPAAGDVYSHRRNVGRLAENMNGMSSHLDASACYHDP